MILNSAEITQLRKFLKTLQALEEKWFVTRKQGFIRCKYKGVVTCPIVRLANQRGSNNSYTCARYILHLEGKVSTKVEQAADDGWDTLLEKTCGVEKEREEWRKNQA